MARASLYEPSDQPQAADFQKKTMAKPKKIRSEEEELFAAWRGSCGESNSRDRALTGDFQLLSCYLTHSLFYAVRALARITLLGWKKWEEMRKKLQPSQ
jgi:hypothetical protein